MIVEAAETLFVPVAVYNNVPGEDARTLKQFEEPSWNNPVVRIVSPDRTLLAPRVNGDYTVGGLARAMVTALGRHGTTVPGYLKLLAEEEQRPRSSLETATFAMHCFWQGELALGSIPGVVATLPGFLRGDEVVEVRYDPRRVDYAALVDRARSLDCATTVYTRTDAQHRIATEKVGREAVRTDESIRPDKQPKYSLFNTELRYLPMTRLQAIRVNQARARKKNVEEVLSPRQRDLLQIIRRHPDAGWRTVVDEKNFAGAWGEARRRALKLAPAKDSSGNDSSRTGSSG